ncbi:MAG: flagellar biosynthetic protein FliO [Candidatus Pristimantibacillus lignocellulolyticus]|uniref:Flagellar biosynthetic protein FliO n=1 Tax=Candidatus Pristimantibacillus lignocellulolyticus TaxID=2994561 RepID=A0A9J6ZBH5_9BACL|nr:MAG: flagellar biosynthetic protein FliO [Candidatus Pristimantibacillus lignocellulolyticus]
MLKLGWKITVLTTLLTMSLPYIAVATDGNSELGVGLSSGVDKMDTGYIGDVIWVFVALAIVITLLIFTIKFLSKRNRAWGTQRGLRSLGGISLGQNSSMQVIEIANRIYVVGVGDQVTLLDKLDDPEIVARIIQELELKEQPMISLSTMKEWLSSSKRSKTDFKENDTNMWNESSSFEDLLQSKLDKQAERKQELESLLKDNNK